MVVDAVLAIRRPDQPIDLHMVEVMEMQHRTDTDTQSVTCGPSAVSDEIAPVIILSQTDTWACT